MITTSKFQELHNKEVERSFLITLLQEAKKENNTNVVYRVSKILNENPNDLVFTLQIKQYKKASVNNPSLTEALTANGTLKKGWSFKNGSVVKTTNSLHTKSDEQFITPDVLAGLEYIEADDQELKTELGKAVTPKEIYKMITEKVIQGVEKVKGNPAMPWDKNFMAKGGYLIPYNFDTKKPYRGVNILLLKNGNPYAGFNNPYFLTFNQVKKLKGKVKPKSKGATVIYFTRFYTFNDQKKKKSFSTYKKDKMTAFFKSNGYDLKQFDFLVKIIPILKYYKVYNGSDIEGIDFGLDKLTPIEKAKFGFVAPSKARHNQGKNQIAELILKNLPSPRVKIEHKENGAFYSSVRDVLNMPKFEAFDSANDYYRILFHELIHSTGHPNRLDRELGNKFGTPKYAKEELIAEFGAVFLSAQAGILWHTHKDHEKYIKNWLYSISLMEKDNTLLMRSATAAQKAADFLLQVNQAGEPKFYKELSKTLGVPTIKKNTSVKDKKGKATKTKVVKKQLNQKSTEKGSTVIKFEGGEMHLHKGLNKVQLFFNSKPSEEVRSYLKSKGHSFRWSPKAKVWQRALKSYAYTDELIDYLNGNYKSKTLNGAVNTQNPINKEVFVEPLPGLEINQEIINSIPVESSTPLKPVNTIQSNISTAEKVKQNCTTSGRNSLATRRQKMKDRRFELYDIADKSMADFIGDIEIKNKESLVLTIAGQRGSMKTRFAFQFMNIMAQKYKVGHASLEEHPETKLYWDKVDQYINETALNNIDNPEIKNLSQLDKLIKENDVIVIDSFAKLQELDSKLQVDTHLRKKYDGKLFLIIFQQTSDGKMRGGAKSGFDGDCIFFVEKKDDYTQNYVRADKNRYERYPTNEIIFNIHSGKTIFLKEQENITPEEIECKNNFIDVVV
ncbi:zincin-like metallopeptidase domain-containing protein [uncultured Tenacibaculum sp.]|uniref:zincin-like metallopeptidase domain-containing protein n=1 Tax=uncultured Tenacibaculum sp. TaxID=174713 RepID=UPI002621728D|nr:zincin-like metallopeptidase domain-containing protein [uncultured Tenacibaculum sp.]